MAEKRLFKEYNQLKKAPAHEANPQILSLLPVDLSNILEWEAVVSKPNKSQSRYYYNGKWKLNIEVPTTYPLTPPKIEFDKSTRICHPNINIDTGEICLDILKQDNWSPAWNLQYLLVAVLMLIDDPEPDSPLNIDLANLFRHDKTAFESVVQYYMWKFGTLLTANSDERDTTGVKPEDDIQEKELDEDTVDVAQDTSNAIHEIKNQAQEIVDDTNSILQSSVDESNSTFSYRITRPIIPNDVQNDIKTKLDLKLSKIDSLKEQLKMPESHQTVPNFKIIHDVGKEVTKQFIAKVDEIGHSSSSSQGSIDETTADNDLNGVKKKVTENVTKQVESLCLKSVSPDTSEFHESVRDMSNKPSNGDVEKIRQNFMKQVDEKIKKHEEHIRKLNTNSPNGGAQLNRDNDADETKSVDKGSSLTDSTKNAETAYEANSIPELSQKIQNQPRWAKDIQAQRAEAENNGNAQARKQPSASSISLSTPPRSSSSQELDGEADTLLQPTDSDSSSKSSFSSLRRSLSRKNPKTPKTASQDDPELSKRKRLLSLLKPKQSDK